MGTIFSDTIPFHPIGQCPVRLYSIECWDAVTGELSAGELGYSVGKIYTSLTGFTLVDSAGSVQLAALGALLCINGFETWDLGMDLDYKQRLGAKKLDRPDFVSLVHTSRCTDCDIRLPNMEKKNCKDVMNSIANDPYQDG
jgi:Leu/Phe-tRNA-protein transferase